MLGNFALKLESGMEKVTRVLSIIGSLFLVVMVFILTAEVIMRAFGSGVLGSYEIVELAMVPLVFLSMANVQSRKRNIQMDLIYTRLPKVLRPFMDLISTIVSIILFVFLVYAAGIQTLYEHSIKDVSAVLYLPKDAFMALEVFGFIVLIIVLLIDILVIINRIVHKQWEAENPKDDVRID